LSNLVGLPTITYGLDGEGRVYSSSASSGQNPLTSTTYNTASLPTQINLGSSDSDTFTYDPNTDRATQYKFNVNGQSVTGTLTWNSIGTLETLAITDPFYGAGNQTCGYTHDDESRIASVSCGSPWAQTFTYDAFGNIKKSGTISFQPTYSYLTNRMTEIGSSTPTYDANGNVLTDTAHTYSWDANGRPTTVDSVGLTYDAFGRMVEQDKSGVYTEIAYAPTGGKLAIMSGQTLQKAYVPLSGGSVAAYASSGLAYYRHSDWLGSSRFASTPGRALYFDGAYAPFGESYAQTGTTDLSFTGMNQDTVSNLFDFPSREYNGIHGRWPSPDPAGLSSVAPRDPQTLNRYAYVTNRPLVSVDPLGLSCVTVTVLNDDGSIFESQADDGDGQGCAGAGVAAGDPDDPGNISPQIVTVDGGDDSGYETDDPGIGLLDASEFPQAPACTAAQQTAATLAKSLENASQTTGWIALGFGVGTAVAGAGEGVSLGFDTPVTITFGSATGFFSTSSFLTGSAAAVLNSFASGNIQSMLDFNWSQLVNVATTAAASKIPGVGAWAETIGNLAEQGRDLATNASEACQQ
jgi:RHS repeat-associated protein